MGLDGRLTEFPYRSNPRVRSGRSAVCAGLSFQPPGVSMSRHDEQDKGWMDTFARRAARVRNRRRRRHRAGTGARRRPGSPCWDCGSLACLAMVGGAIWLLAGDFESRGCAGRFRVPTRQALRLCGIVSLRPRRPDPGVVQPRLDGKLVGGRRGWGPAQDPSRESLIGTLPHGAGVIEAAFSPDGRTFVTVGLHALTFWSHGPATEEVVERVPGELFRSSRSPPTAGRSRWA